MKACPSIPFTALLADTILEHGTSFAEATILASLPAWERRFWLLHPAIVQASRAHAGLEFARFLARHF